MLKPRLFIVIIEIIADPIVMATIAASMYAYFDYFNYLPQDIYEEQIWFLYPCAIVVSQYWVRNTAVSKGFQH